jgi:hypothetical protein
MTQPGPLVDWTDGAKVLRVSGKASRIRVPIALLNHGGETLHLATALVQGLHHHLLRQQLPDVTLPLGLSVRPHMAAGSSGSIRPRRPVSIAAISALAASCGRWKSLSLKISRSISRRIHW